MHFRAVVLSYWQDRIQQRNLEIKIGAASPAVAMDASEAIESSRTIFR
jgi:hypothetical protein